MKTSLKLSNTQKFFDDFTPTQENYFTPSEMMLELEKKTQNAKYLIDLDEVEIVSYKSDGDAIFELVSFDSDIYGNKVVTYKYMITVS